MNPLKLARLAVLLVLGVTAGTASAHTGDLNVTGFVGGLAHPLLGLDHLLAMIAVGLWAAQQGGRALWAWPLTFVTVMAGGGLLAGVGVHLAHVETVVALSVLALGGCLALDRSWRPLVGMALVAGFAAFHGYAHGLERPPGAAPALYAAGFVLATVVLHGVGIAAGTGMRRWMHAMGMGIAATGAALLLGF